MENGGWIAPEILQWLSGIHQIFFLLPLRPDVLYMQEKYSSMELILILILKLEFANTRGQKHLGIFEHFGSNLGLTGTLVSYMKQRDNS